MKIKAHRLTFILFLVFIATIQIGGCKKDPAPPVPIPTPSPAPNTCTCDTQALVCNNGTATCAPVECERASYKDGICSGFGGPPITQPFRADTAKLFGVSFSSYQDAIRSGSGRPDAAMWDAINKSAPSQDVAKAVTYMTNDFIYISFAQDVNILTPKGLSGACEIASVSDKKATLGLIEAIKAGTIMALKKSDPSAVKAPISEFFKKFPDFKPNYPGFCYTEKTLGTPADCIGGILEKRLQLLIGQ